MSGISLTASMRSNLLSLQNISGQVSSTQNKLATGNKVNSAIDNPSSYYTALSLNNRADDLNALLDSMGQAVSTIKAATTALESATDFLEQAKAVANQALETAKVPSKSFFEERVGENGAVVTTAQELRDAINSGKETICVYGAIDLGDISTTGGLTLKENQKLVGVGYFGNYDTDTNKFSSISATANAVKDMIIVNGNNTTISDLSIDYDNNVAAGEISAVYIAGKAGDQYKNSLHNLDVYTNFSDGSQSQKAAIKINSSKISASGKISVYSKGQRVHSFQTKNDSVLDIEHDTQINIQNYGANSSGVNCGGSVVNIYSGANINIQNYGESAVGLSTSNSVLTNINSNAKLNISCTGNNGVGILSAGQSTVDIQKDAHINIQTYELFGYGIQVGGLSFCNISGNVCIYTRQRYAYGFCNQSGEVNIGNSAQIHLNTAEAPFWNGPTSGTYTNILNISKGAKLALEKEGKTDWYEVEDDWKNENTSTTTSNTITADGLKNQLNLESTSAWELPEKAEIDWEDSNSSGETAKQDLADAGKNYQEIINQYDSLIKDASYKGINLLQADKLTVKFNETNTADLSVQGKDMGTKALGLTTFEWQSQGDINKSLEELTSAINAIRSYSSELGNNYNIITTRQDFTESLINVLTEGADKLTLADMNEESANMLALQTRQQLAINSLSLASQASQSILKLF